MILSLLKNIRNRDMGRRSDDYIRDFLSGAPLDAGVKTLSGARIGDESQLQVNVNFSCITFIAETIGSLTPNLYRPRKSGGWDIAYAEPLQQAITDVPNPEMSGFTYRETQTAHAALYGNKYAYIGRDGRGRVNEFWPLMPPLVKQTRSDDGQIQYEVKSPDGLVVYGKNDILHIPGLSMNGLNGKSKKHWQSGRLGIAKALDEYEARFFGQGFNSSLIGIWGGRGDGRPAQWANNETAAARIAALEEKFARPERAHGLMIVDGGIEIKELANRLDYSMLDERQKAVATAICGMWRVPPPLIGILDRATFSNITRLDLAYGKHCIRIWAERDESAFSAWLLSPQQRAEGWKIEYSLDEIYRADFETMSRAYKEQWDRGVISSDEWRAFLNMNPKPNGGDRYYVPVNYQRE